VTQSLTYRGIREALARAGVLFRNRSFKALSRFLSTLLALVVGYSIVFQVVMAYEGQSQSWVSGLYWTLTTMSTLGYGDIVFATDIGRSFSILVLLSGIVFMLVLLPFTFIQFVYEPWMERRAASLVPRAVLQFNYPDVVVLPEHDEVSSLREEGVVAICGELDNLIGIDQDEHTSGAFVDDR